jgi:endoglucanase
MKPNTKLFLIIFLILITPCLISAGTSVRLNSLGFFPLNDKTATISGACTAFTIVRVSDGSVRYTGTVAGPLSDAQTGESNLYTADFSALSETGEFYMNVSNGAASLDTSVNFIIDPGAFDAPFVTVFKGMYEWRCGTAVSVTYNGTTWSHAACHLNDANDAQVGGTGSVKPSTKGWHDAGDYNKYTVNAGVTLGMLFMAWEMFGSKINLLSYGLPETAPGYPEFLKELKWETDWLLTMQPADGSCYDKVSEVNFCSFELPEYNTETRYFWGVTGTAETAELCAMLAMASRNFRPYDAAYANTCQNAALKAYNYINTHPTNYQTVITGCGTGDYTSGDADAARIWAAAEMWETTGTGSYLTDFETKTGTYPGSIVVADFNWNNVINLGMYTYVLSTRSGRNASLLASLQNQITSTADGIVSTRNSHPYGRTLGSNYYWGCNGSVARQAMILQVANQISPKPAYLNTALDAVGYLFGRNMHDRSYVTGVGINPPLHPHHRPSGGDSIVAPWPGYLVGGSPGNKYQDNYESANMPAGLPAAQYWIDVQDAYSANEVAINWQGALIYAMAGFVSGIPTPTSTLTPTVTGTPPTPTVTITVTITPTMIADRLDLHDYYTFPNPSIGDVIKFRYTHAGAVDRVKITVFTISNRKIAEINDSGKFGDPYPSVTVWTPPGRLGSGLYYYLLELTGRDKAVIKKIGTFVVVKNMTQ